MGPGPLVNSSMVGTTHGVILFGGLNIQRNDNTWKWDGNLWRQSEDIGPIPRSNHAVAYDAKRDRVALFGGYGPATETFGDTWELRIE